MFIIWILSETEFLAVRENLPKAFWVVFAQCLYTHFHLLLFDVGVLLSL